MISSVNLQDVKQKLYKKLEISGWDDKLRSFLLGNEMDKVLDALLKEAMDGKRFTPPMKHIFRAFEECPYDKVNVVIIGQDPYPQIETADGLAFSCSIKDKPEVSLQHILKAIKESVPEELQDPNPTNNLDRWAKQGVLLLNSAFTCTIGKPGTHYLLWRPFLINVIDSMMWSKPDTVYVFLGKKAQDYMDLIPDTGCKIAVEHPAAAAYKGSIWDHGDMFNKINECLDMQGKPKIIW
jgi:uracil-DNA glycosylase